MLLGIASRYPKHSVKLIRQVKADSNEIGEAAQVLAQGLNSGRKYESHKGLVDSIRKSIPDGTKARRKN